jgi:aarF domain-containing kinase
MDNWLRLLQAAASADRITCTEVSRSLWYLTGEENEVRSSPTYFHPTHVLTHQTQIMLDAHIDSMVLLATPFKSTTPQPFAFGPGTPWADITAHIRANISVMLKHRLTPRLRAIVDTMNGT